MRFSKFDFYAVLVEGKSVPDARLPHEPSDAGVTNFNALTFLQDHCPQFDLSTFGALETKRHLPCKVFGVCIQLVSAFSIVEFVCCQTSLGMLGSILLGRL